MGTSCWCLGTWPEVVHFGALQYKREGKLGALEIDAVPFVETNGLILLKRWGKRDRDMSPLVKGVCQRV